MPKGKAGKGHSGETKALSCLTGVTKKFHVFQMGLWLKEAPRGCMPLHFQNQLFQDSAFLIACN